MRLAEALGRGPGRASYLVPYLLVDRGRSARWGALVDALRDGGADAVELGFPFSDPIADGPTLAGASARALAAGTRWSDLVAAVRTTATRLPTAVMTYANPVWQHGLEPATAELGAAGAEALVVPDLAWEETAPWRRAARRGGLDLVGFLAPGLSAGRTARIAASAEGYLYLVARYGTTGGGATGPAPDLRGIVAAAHRTRPDLAVLAGFGVADVRSRRAALRSGADGVIVGSALEGRIAAGATPRAIARWLRELRGPVA